MVGRRETFVKFKRGSFEGKKDNWSFKIDENSIVATIGDDTFLNKVKSAEVGPSSADAVKVKIRENQRIKNGETKTKNEILEVSEYLEAQKQNKLDFE